MKKGGWEREVTCGETKTPVLLNSNDAVFVITTKILNWCWLKIKSNLTVNLVGFTWVKFREGVSQIHSAIITLTFKDFPTQSCPCRATFLQICKKFCKSNESFANKFNQVCWQQSWALRPLLSALIYSSYSIHVRTSAPRDVMVQTAHQGIICTSRHAKGIHPPLYEWACKPFTLCTRL